MFRDGIEQPPAYGLIGFANDQESIELADALDLPLLPGGRGQRGDGGVQRQRAGGPRRGPDADRALVRRQVARMQRLLEIAVLEVDVHDRSARPLGAVAEVPDERLFVLEVALR